MLVIIGIAGMLFTLGIMPEYGPIPLICVTIITAIAIICEYWKPSE